ncbi:MAG: 50S ribosomal protein L11 methyltransferase [Gammaproteobacteria bacterium]|nr:MAG: 50S ribosomal protein L11 methyltransferase [Gammaproteobacteria bacterium]
MPWIQCHLTVDKSQAPLVELMLEAQGALSVSLEDAGDEPMLEPPPGETPLWQATRISGLFPGDTDIDQLRSGIGQALARDLGHNLQIEVLEDRDWERVWLERFAPMRFGHRLWVRPGEAPIPDPDGIIVDLDPGLAFGTGTHPTTALCLEWLDRAELADKEIIDFGCGSGILAIAALKLGASRAVAIDHDPQALTATRENATRNGVIDRLEIVDDQNLPERPVPLVLANILANVLIALQPRLTALVAPGGELVLSGVLAEQADAVIDAFTAELEFSCPQQRDGWVLLHGHRRSAADAPS